MARPSLITQWLSDPNSFTAADQEVLDALIDTHPYFTPARYIRAARQQREEPFAPAMMGSIQLFSGNWLLLYQYLEACEVIPQQVVPAQANEELVSEAPAQVEALPEEITAPETPTAPQSILHEDVPHEVMLETIETLPIAELPEVQQKGPEEEIVYEELIAEPAKPDAEIIANKPEPKRNRPVTEEQTIKPLFTQDYFLAQGIEIPDANQPEPQVEDKDRSLMVVMSFSEWLMYFKTKNERDRQEQEDKKALKSMWQKEKLAAALEEENEEIPEAVFNMAVSSITKEDDLASESLAEVLQKQGKYDKAIDMYRKLSLRNPQKSAYFASKVEQINKQIDS